MREANPCIKRKNARQTAFGSPSDHPVEGKSVHWKKKCNKVKSSPCTRVKNVRYRRVITALVIHSDVSCPGAIAAGMPDRVVADPLRMRHYCSAGVFPLEQ